MLVQDFAPAVFLGTHLMFTVYIFTMSVKMQKKPYLVFIA